MATIGICGCGVVGGSLAKWFSEHTTHVLKIYDPGLGKYDDLSDCLATFICVPVNNNEDWTQDYSILEETICRSGGIKFIRSTVLPGTNDRYMTFSCPEFLTERTAYEDTCKMPILTGCSDVDLMSEIFPGKELLIMTNKECEMAKYAHNVFGAMKVNYFNNIYDLCEREEIDYKMVMEGVLMSGYINDVHTKVPGPDGLFGFGGKCFPKDTMAFYSKYPMLSFGAILNENLLHRVKPQAD
jgi:UDP-glucose 6-dehydrogenase